MSDVAHRPRDDDRPAGAEELRELLVMLRRRKLVILVALVITPALAFALSVHSTPAYQATSQVLAGQTNIAAAVVADPTFNPIPDPQRYEATQAQIARLPTLVHRVIAVSGARVSVDDFLASSSVTSSPTSDLLSFSVLSADPAEGQRLATAYARQFVAYQNGLDTRPLRATRHRLRERERALEKRGLAKTALYSSLLQADQRLQALEAIAEQSTSVVQPAPQAVRVKPRPVKNLALGVALGLVLAVGGALLIDALDTRLRRGAEIQRLLDLPLLGELPRPPATGIALFTQPEGPYAEAVRKLYANLVFFGDMQSRKIVLVTSATHEEGKSTTAVNLALAAARAGGRVVLCDLDARRPAIDGYFDLADRPGLSDVIAGRATLAAALHRVPLLASVVANGWPTLPSVAPPPDEYVRNDASGSLDVLTTGEGAKRDAADFVASEAVYQVLDELRVRSDFVIVDAPPLLPVSDPLIISQHADVMLVVAKVGTLRRTMITQLRRLLASTPIRARALVLTGVNLADDYSQYYTSSAIVGVANAQAGGT